MSILVIWAIILVVVTLIARALIDNIYLRWGAVVIVMAMVFSALH